MTTTTGEAMGLALTPRTRERVTSETASARRRQGPAGATEVTSRPGRLRVTEAMLGALPEALERHLGPHVRAGRAVHLLPGPQLVAVIE